MSQYWFSAAVLIGTLRVKTKSNDRGGRLFYPFVLEIDDWGIVGCFRI